MISAASMPIPDDFLCPILKEPFLDPVCTCDGHTYERGAIQEWFMRNHNTSPKTGLPLGSKALNSNVALRGAIETYMHLRGIVEAGHREKTDLEYAVKIFEEDTEMKLRGKEESAHQLEITNSEIRSSRDKAKRRIQLLEKESKDALAARIQDKERIGELEKESTEAVEYTEQQAMQLESERRRHEQMIHELVSERDQGNELIQELRLKITETSSERDQIRDRVQQFVTSTGRENLDGVQLAWEWLSKYSKECAGNMVDTHLGKNVPADLRHELLSQFLLPPVRKFSPGRASEITIDIIQNRTNSQISRALNTGNRMDGLRHEVAEAVRRLDRHP